MIRWCIVKDLSQIKNTSAVIRYDDRMVCIWPLIDMMGMTSENRGKEGFQVS